jgi:hypothetical protein
VAPVRAIPSAGDFTRASVDVLRLYLAAGVIESLGLPIQPGWRHYISVTSIRSRRRRCMAAPEICVQGQAKISHTNWRMLDETTLAVAQEAARKVGNYLGNGEVNAGAAQRPDIDLMMSMKPRAQDVASASP